MSVFNGFISHDFQNTWSNNGTAIMAILMLVNFMIKVLINSIKNNPPQVVTT